MNIFGHAYVAIHAISGDKRLLIVGSLLPESFPFIPDNPFTNEEIHEGGEKLLEFFDKKYPGKRDLALGMISHSVKFGADGFNREIESYAGRQKEELLAKIADCSGVNLETAQKRLHNFLWWGVDVWILKEDPQFVEEVGSVVREADVAGVSKLLSEAFGKDEQIVYRVVEKLFGEIYNPSDLFSIEGLARIWARQVVELPEKDKIDVQKTVEVFGNCSFILEDNWKYLLHKVGQKVKENLRKF